MNKRPHRLVTKCDLDGLACGILLKEMGLIDRIAFAHPRDIESGRMEITADDTTAGLPCKESAHLAFARFPSRSMTGEKRGNIIFDQSMLSTARVIYNHYGRAHFPRISPDMLEATDKGVSGNISIDDILHPTGWILLNHLIDHRTGLEPSQQSSICTSELSMKPADYCILSGTCFNCPRSLPQLIMELTDRCGGQTIWEILSLPDMEERLHLYFLSIDRYKDQLLRCASIHSNLVVIDMRQEQVFYPGNRFMVYALFPECNVSLQVHADPGGNKTVFAVGKSILDRSYSRDIGKILKQYGGGGHANAGTCQVRSDQADEVLSRLIGELEYSPLKNLFFGYFNYYQYRQPDLKRSELEQGTRDSETETS